MFASLIWAWFVLSLAVGVVPVAAMWVRDGRNGRAAFVLVAFIAATCVSSPASAGVPPAGTVVLGPGAGGQAVDCTPGAILVYVYEYDTHARFDGACPPSGTVVCGTQTGSGGQTPYWYGAGACYEVWATDGGTGSPDPGTGQSVSLKPFDMPAADGALISAAILGVWLSAWGIRAVIDVLRDRKDGD